MEIGNITIRKASYILSELEKSYSENSKELVEELLQVYQCRILGLCIYRTWDNDIKLRKALAVRHRASLPRYTIVIFDDDNAPSGASIQRLAKQRHPHLIGATGKYICLKAGNRLTEPPKGFWSTDGIR